MPYDKWDEVNDAIKGIEPRVSLKQANLIAKWADAMAEAEDGPENPWAAAIARFKELFEVEDGRWVRKEADAGEFFFAELAEDHALAQSQPVEFLRVGTFRDAHGRVVEVTEDLLDELVANFYAGSAGQEVPIDVDHEKAEAAGWVQRIWRDGDRLLASVDWNTLGKKLVGQRTYRYLSATIDMAQQVLKSISLVNFPAVKGLQPVQLGEGGYTMKLGEGLFERLMAGIRSSIKEVFADVEAGESGDDGGEPPVDEGGDGESSSEEGDEHEEGTMGEREELKAELRKEIMAELAEEQPDEAEMREAIRAEVEAELREDLERRQELVAFAEEICGGEAGLSTDPDELVELMASMEEDELEQFQEVLNAKVVDFSEHGSSRPGRGELKEFPAALRSTLETWIEDGNDVEEFFEVNAAELGEMEEYDLSEIVATE